MHMYMNINFCILITLKSQVTIFKLLFFISLSNSRMILKFDNIGGVTKIHIEFSFKGSIRLKGELNELLQ